MRRQRQVEFLSHRQQIERRNRRAWRVLARCFAVFFFILMVIYVVLMIEGS